MKWVGVPAGAATAVSVQEPVPSVRVTVQSGPVAPMALIVTVPVGTMPDPEEPGATFTEKRSGWPEIGGVVGRVRVMPVIVVTLDCFPTSTEYDPTDAA